MPGLQINNIHKDFVDKNILNGITFYQKPGEIIVVLGPSGSGKSTLLNIIAGLVQPDKGEIYWNRKLMNHIPVHERNFGLMFQDYALFPHMNVFDNIAFGLRMKRIPKDELFSRVREIIDLIGLNNYEKRDINTLSGGEKQRVAFARSLAPRPELLMLDEPLGALDRRLKDQLIEELKGILQKTKQTTIYVTHDQEEAFSLADIVIILNHGRIVQRDTPQQIYQNPSSTFVAQFLGLNNIFPSIINFSGTSTIVKTPFGEFKINKHPRLTKESNFVLFRPDRFYIGKDSKITLNGLVIDSSFRGNNCRLLIKVNQHNLALDVPTQFMSIPEVNKNIQISFDPDKTIQILTE